MTKQKPQVNVKVCIDCKITKAATSENFYRHKKQKHFASRCQQCDRLDAIRRQRIKRFNHVGGLQGLDQYIERLREELAEYLSIRDELHIATFTNKDKNYGK